MGYTSKLFGYKQTLSSIFLILLWHIWSLYCPKDSIWMTFQFTPFLLHPIAVSSAGYWQDADFSHLLLSVKGELTYCPLAWLSDLPLIQRKRFQISDFLGSLGSWSSWGVWYYSHIQETLEMWNGFTELEQWLNEFQASNLWS